MEKTVGNIEAIETFTYKKLKLKVEWFGCNCTDGCKERNEKAIKKAINKIEGIDEIIVINLPVVVVTCIADFDAQKLIDKINSLKKVEKALLEYQSTPITIPRKNKLLPKVVKKFKGLLGRGGASGSSDAKMEPNKKVENTPPSSSCV